MSIPVNERLPAYPSSALDFASRDEKEREHTSRVDELRPANKTVLFDALAAVNIAVIIVT